jgi:SpoVK/Ycf46/Vps4 family AAA+-type ATPase
MVDDGTGSDGSVCAKPLASVVMEAQKKKDLIADLKKFLDPQSKSFYCNHNIPFKRVYLFHGPRRSGRSTMVKAIAGYYQRDLYSIDLSWVNFSDISLGKALQAISADAFIELQNVDRACSAKQGGKPSIAANDLMNTLDDLCDGRVVFLTTQYKDKLSPQISRRGRIDVHVEFDYLQRGEVRDLWNTHFPENDTVSDEFADCLSSSLVSDTTYDITAGQLCQYFHRHRDAFAAFESVNCIADHVDLHKSEKSDAKAATWLGGCCIGSSWFSYVSDGRWQNWLHCFHLLQLLHIVFYVHIAGASDDSSMQ